jgi:hypothetical protein
MYMEKRFIKLISKISCIIYFTVGKLQEDRELLGIVEEAGTHNIRNHNSHVNRIVVIIMIIIIMIILIMMALNP